MYKAAVEKIITEVNPDAIIHCVGYFMETHCQRDTEEAGIDIMFV